VIRWRKPLVFLSCLVPLALPADVWLFSFFYVTLHFLTYIWRDKFFDMHEMLVDVAKRKFITVGFTGLCC
jgi:DMSO/TMAO reductase YedYZ heme-binding membrane subunit